MDLKEIGLEGMEWIHLAQDRDKWLDFCKHGNVPPGSIESGKFLDYLRNDWLVKKDSTTWNS
jgi:hypothetical protein